MEPNLHCRVTAGAFMFEMILSCFPVFPVFPPVPHLRPLAAWNAESTQGCQVLRLVLNMWLGYITLENPRQWNTSYHIPTWFYVFFLEIDCYFIIVILSEWPTYCLTDLCYNHTKVNLDPMCYFDLCASNSWYFTSLRNNMNPINYGWIGWLSIIVICIL